MPVEIPSSPESYCSARQLCRDTTAPRLRNSWVSSSMTLTTHTLDTATTAIQKTPQAAADWWKAESTAKSFGQCTCSCYVSLFGTQRNPTPLYPKFPKLPSPLEDTRHAVPYSWKTQEILWLWVGDFATQFFSVCLTGVDHQRDSHRTTSGRCTHQKMWPPQQVPRSAPEHADFCVHAANGRAPLVLVEHIASATTRATSACARCTRNAWWAVLMDHHSSSAQIDYRESSSRLWLRPLW